MNTIELHFHYSKPNSAKSDFVTIPVKALHARPKKIEWSEGKRGVGFRLNLRWGILKREGKRYAERADLAEVQPRAKGAGLYQNYRECETGTIAFFLSEISPDWPKEIEPEWVHRIEAKARNSHYHKPINQKSNE